MVGVRTSGGADIFVRGALNKSIAAQGRTWAEREVDRPLARCLQKFNRTCVDRMHQIRATCLCTAPPRRFVFDTCAKRLGALRWLSPTPAKCRNELPLQVRDVIDEVGGNVDVAAMRVQPFVGPIVQEVERARVGALGEMIRLEEVPLDVLRNRALIPESSAAYPELNVVAVCVHVLLLRIVHHVKCICSRL
jgi:hypothetical protein